MHGLGTAVLLRNGALIRSSGDHVRTTEMVAHLRGGHVPGDRDGGLKIKD